MQLPLFFKRLTSSITAALLQSIKSEKKRFMTLNTCNYTLEQLLTSRAQQFGLWI
jgi:hypothetical protein